MFSERSASRCESARTRDECLRDAAALLDQIRYEIALRSHDSDGRDVASGEGKAWTGRPR